MNGGSRTEWKFNGSWNPKELTNSSTRRRQRGDDCPLVLIDNTKDKVLYCTPTETNVQSWNVLRALFGLFGRRQEWVGRREVQYKGRCHDDLEVNCTKRTGGLVECLLLVL